ncbi:MAG TPA: ABC transporter permease [Stellaceae bacterium]|nr:ABC transporter permease [Stellaceae bacterium]
MTSSQTVLGVLADASASAPAQSSRTLAAVADILAGLHQSWLWTTLAHQDLKLRYRGSILGPFWQTITTAVMIGAMGFIYAKLFHTPLEHYLPLLTTGLVLWQFVSGMITDGCGTFFSVQGIIQQVKLPFSLHAYRIVYRNLLILLHNFVIIPIVLMMFPQPIQWLRLLELGPGLALILLNGVWISILLGMISARFRDIPPIVASIVQVVFFITPIFWPADGLGPHRWLAEINPLYAAIDVMRAPLLGQPHEPYSWLILVAVTVFGCAASFAFFARFRTRIAFWV